MDELNSALGDAFHELGIVVLDETTVEVPTHPTPTRVRVDARWRAQPLGVTEAERWRNGQPQPVILALAHVPAGIGQHYRRLGINYIDSGGNAYLDLPGFRAHIEGRKPRVSCAISTRAAPPAGTPAGLKVIFALLIAPDLVRQTHEDIARLSTASKGTVTNTLTDLRRRGHLYGEREQRALLETDRLARDWVGAYLRDLQPRLKTTTLNGPPPTWWTKNPHGGQLSGGTALAQLGATLEPDRTLLYGDPPWAAIRTGGRLTRDDGSPVTLRQRFWSPELVSGSFVPPILAYADGMSSLDPQEVDAARELAHQTRGPSHEPPPSPSSLGKACPRGS